MKFTSSILLTTALVASSVTAQTVTVVNNGQTSYLTGSAAESWKTSFSSQLSSDLSDVNASCFPFCSSTSGELNPSSLASSISAEVSSNLASATASSMGGSAATSASGAMASATSASGSSNAAGIVGGKASGVANWHLMVAMVGAGAVGAAAALL